MTGADGYIGQHFLKCFENLHNDRLILMTLKDINGYDNIDYSGFRFNSSSFDALAIDHIDVLLLMGAYVEHGKNIPHVVRNHLSSITSIDYLLNNIPIKPRKVVYCSTIAVYGIDSSLPYKSSGGVLLNEEAKTDPIRTYAMSKAFGERLVTEWCKENSVECQIVRIGSVYDCETDINSFMGYMLKAYRNKECFKMIAPPEQLWNYVYIDDICRWIINALYLSETPGVINLTADRNYTSMELVELLKIYDNSFCYEIPDKINYCGVDKGFDSRKRKQYLGDELFPINDIFKRIIAKIH